MKYFTHSTLDDDFGTGVSVSAQNVADDVVAKGFLPKEITEEEYIVWKERIANPDNVKYFSGIFPGIGVVDKATRKMIDAKQAEGYKSYCEQQCKSQRINFKLAQRDAEAIGEDHEATFTSKHPQVSEDVKAMLFAEVRAAQAKAVKKGK